MHSSADSRKNMPTQAIVNLACPTVYVNIPVELIVSAKLVLAALRETNQDTAVPETLSVVSRGVFEDAATLERVVVVRFRWLLDIIARLCSGEHRITEADHETVCAALRLSFDKVVVADALQTTSESWQSFCNSIFGAALRQSTLGSMQEQVQAVCEEYTSKSSGPSRGQASDTTPMEEALADKPQEASGHISDEPVPPSTACLASPKFTSVVEARNQLRPEGQVVEGPIVAAFIARLHPFITSAAVVRGAWLRRHADRLI